LSTSPTLKVLILAGGKSRRMKQDKSLLSYKDGKPHPIYLANLCTDLGYEVFLSRAKSEDDDFLYGIPVLKDRIEDIGPIAGLEAAFHQSGESAWLLLACDLPFINRACIEHLMNNRDKTALATIYQLPHKSMPEPLMAIYEPNIIPYLTNCIENKRYAFMCMLENEVIKRIPLEDAQQAFNVNTPEDYDQANALLDDHP